MAAKTLKKRIKVVIPGASATPAPPLGPALGQAGIPINDFVSLFNDKTQDLKGKPLPTTILVYDDKSFDLIVKKPQTRFLIKDKIKLTKGSGKPHIEKVATITETQLREIYEEKKEDLNAHDADQGIKILAGSCRAMGVTVNWGE
jgi:large subunit ribosomal protein L11